jgi:hypothetical protein
MVSRGRGHEIADRGAPTAAERGDLSARRHVLLDSLRAPPSDTIKRRLAKLFGLLATGGIDGESLVGLLDDYVKLLSHEPLWAVDAACLAVINSGAVFRPTGPQFLAMARKAADAARIELHDIEAVLNASVYHAPDPAEKERVLARFKGMISECGLGQPVGESRSKPRPAPAARDPIADAA